MKSLQCRNIILDNSKAKICIPVMGNNKSEVLEQALQVKNMNPDIVEWRMDYYNLKEKDKKGCADFEEYIEVLKELHQVMGKIPLILTFRTGDEGGEKSVDYFKYEKICKAVSGVGADNNVAFIDVEAYGNRECAKELISYIKNNDVKVIASNHHFDRTPSKEEMLDILLTMENMGADVCKIAVMPKEKNDVTMLIETSKEADEKLTVPLVSMSMGELGAVTRICTDLTGSVLSFAAGTDVSAPGQIDIKKLRYLQNIGKGCRVKKNISLIGFMGTGKTTISQALSGITGLEEVDVDQYIVEKACMEISEIFEKYGEEYFRNLETQALSELQNKKGQIISCGGGAVLRDKNVEILKKGGSIILLTATPETIFERVKDHTHRPILNKDMSIEHVTRLMEAREPRYQAVADIKVNVDDNDRVMTCYEILKKLEEKGEMEVK